jgi:hypothetical protein
VKRCLRCGLEVVSVAEKYCSLCLITFGNRRVNFSDLEDNAGGLHPYADDQDDPAFRAGRGDFDMRTPRQETW